MKNLKGRLEKSKSIFCLPLQQKGEKKNHPLSQREFLTSLFVVFLKLENSIEQSTEKLQIAIPFPPKQWHNLSLSFFFFFFHFLLSSSLAKELISCQAKYIYRTLFLSFEHTKITSISEFCNVRCQALLQNQLRHVLPFYVGNYYHTFMFRLKLLLCLFKKKRRCNLKKQRCNLKIRYSCFLCPLLELPEMSLFCFICFLAWELNPFCL